MSGLSGTLSLLREAASQVAAEESQAGLDGLLTAADEIATERGLMSPLRYASPTERRFDEPEREETAAPTVAPTAASAPHKDEQRELSPRPPQSQQSVLDDAAALLQNMALQPKPSSSSSSSAHSATVSFADQGAHQPLRLAQTENIAAPRRILPQGQGERDAAEAAAAHTQQGERETAAPQQTQSRRARPSSARSLSLSQRELERRSRDAQRYLDHYAALSRNAHDAQRSLLSDSLSRASTTSSLSAQRSKVASLLAKADEKPLRERLRDSFRSDAEEKLFRATRTVCVHSHSAERDSKTERKEDSPRGTNKSDRERERERARERERQVRKSVDRLARPAVKGPSDELRRRDPTQRFLTLEEARETTFRPRINGRADRKHKDRDRDRDGGDKKEDARFSFINRQEAELRVREEERRFLQGRADYDALVDKKQCPRCGAKQSFDEVREKRKLCPNCRVPYAYLKSWTSASARAFFESCAAHAKTSQRNKERLAKEVEAESKTFFVQRVDAKSGKIVQLRVDKSQSVVLSREEEEEFLRRLEEQHAGRQVRLQELEKSVYDASCPFRPTIHQAQRKKHSDEEDDEALSDDDDKDSDPVQAFLHRYEEDLLHRVETMPQRYRRSHRLAEDDRSSASENEDEREKSRRPFRFGLTI